MSREKVHDTLRGLFSIFFSFFVLSCSTKPFSPSFLSPESNCYDENSIAFFTAASSLSLKKLNYMKALIAGTEAFAAQADPGYCDQYQKTEGPKLTITWEANAKPQAVGWLGSTSCTKVSLIAKQITIKRVGFGKIPNQLLVVPRNRSLQPKILDISANQKKVHFSTKKIASNEIWLWGNTLKSPCEKEGCPSVPLPYEVGVSSFSNTLRGVFLQKLSSKKDLLPLRFYPTGQFGVSYFTFQNIPIPIKGFQAHGKEKDLFSPQTESWGKSSEIIIKIQYKKNLGICPLY